jgi:hypothetical protein
LRCGRKRQTGARELNGRLRRASVTERDPEMLETLFVLRQPHRRGEIDQRIESPLGRLVLRHKLPRELYDAATEYAGMVRCFYAAKMPAGATMGIPQLPGDDRHGLGAGVSQEKAVWLEKELRRLEVPLRRLDPVGFSALKTLCVHERDIAPEAEMATVVVLRELGLLLRKTGRR